MAIQFDRSVLVEKISGPRLLAALLAAVLLTSPIALHAEKPSFDIPVPLKPWVTWVQHDLPDLDCARMSNGTRQCAWPGELSLNVEATEGRFELTAWLDREAFIRLPGDKDYWPQDVKAANAGALVVSKMGEHPVVWLSRGAHTISGRFVWPTPPEVLSIAPETGRIQLRIRDGEVAYPRLDGEGRLWLQDGSGDADGPKETDSLHGLVYRRLRDGVPMRITTRLELKVSGRAREISLGRILIAGARPVAVRTAIPVQVSPEGSIKLYAKPGNHRVEIDSLIIPETSALRVPNMSTDTFGPHEVWVWLSNERHRSVEVSGLQSIDQDRTSLGQDWKGNITFLVEGGQTMTLTQTRRGEQALPPNLVNLSRQLWLDLDGTGYTVRDTLTGTFNQGWRLNYTKTGTLGRVSANGNDLLITSDPEEKLSGVELRQSTLKLDAELRLDANRKHVDIVGWNHDVQSLSALVHLPPGWELLGGRGVDDMGGTWLDSWTLFDFFFVLMVALALGKLCAWPWALVAGLALCLSHGHGDAPEQLWIHLLVSLGLLRVLPQGWFRRAVICYRGLALVVLAIVLAGYAHEQIRFALHPQVAHAHVTRGFSNELAGLESLMEEDEILAGAPAGSSKRKESSFGLKGRRKVGKKGMRKSDWAARQSQALQQIDPNAIVQTGPGLPQWSWRSWRLNWSGPVRKDHQISLWLISPVMNRSLAFLRVALLILMALLLIAGKDMTWTKPNDDDESEVAAESVGSSFVRSLMSVPWILATMSSAMMLARPPAANAEPEIPLQMQTQNMAPFNSVNTALPDAELSPLLKQLRQRIQQDSACRGACVVVSRADVSVSQLAWTMKAEIHVQKDSAWRLPGPSSSLRLRELRIDGRRTTQLRREAGGLTVVRLGPGRHVLTMTATLVNRNVVTVQFDNEARPQYVSFTSDDWSVDGVSNTGVPDNSLQLTRRQKESARTQDANMEMSSELAPWFSIKRHFALGLPWQVRTEIQRENSDRPQLLKIPLVADEKIFSEGARVEDGLVIVDFPRGVSTVRYDSELAIKPRLDLTAPKDRDWTETWTVECSRIWRCAFAGLPPVQSTDGSGHYRPLFMPWPGEQLRIDILRPAGTPGQASTVDDVRYTITPGKRLLQAQLDLTIRASQGGWQKVTLPEGAELQTVKIEGQTRNIRPQGQLVNLPLGAGKQKFELRWQQPWERKMRELMPTVNIGSSAVNANLTIHPGADRWLLWTSGPSWGPAVLFWSHLLILLGFAFLLGRLRKLPLKTYEWLLLTIGMSQLPFVAFVPVVAWFVVLAWRSHAPQTVAWRFNMLQLSLVLVTLTAVGVLYGAIHSNLLVDVDMQVRGANSTNSTLRWYIDQSVGVLPSASILSLPLLVWRLMMLGWALWLVSRLLKWVPWGWNCFSADGLWRASPKRPQKKQAATATPRPIPPPSTPPKPPPPTGAV